MGLQIAVNRQIWGLGKTLEIEERLPEFYADQVGDWLDGVCSWTFWGTFTYRNSPSLPSVRRSMSRFDEEISPSLMFWGSESGACTGRNHVHALLYFDENRISTPLYGAVPISAHGLWSVAFKRFGRSHVDAFDQKLGASHYVAKYVSKRLSDWDLITNDHADPLRHPHARQNHRGRASPHRTTRGDPVAVRDHLRLHAAD